MRNFHSASYNQHQVLQYIYKDQHAQQWAQQHTMNFDCKPNYIPTIEIRYLLASTAALSGNECLLVFV
jgi:hypothetical protein